MGSKGAEACGIEGNVGNEGRARQRLREPVFRTSEGPPKGRKGGKTGSGGSAEKVPRAGECRSRTALRKKVSGLWGVWFQDSCIFFLFSGTGGVFHHLPALPAIGAEADPESVKIQGKSVFRRLEDVRFLVLKGARVRPAEGGRKALSAIFPVIPTWCRIGICAARFSGGGAQIFFAAEEGLCKGGKEQGKNRKMEKF